jgi:hypothetical protein
MVKGWGLYSYIIQELPISIVRSAIPPKLLNLFSKDFIRKAELEELEEDEDDPRGSSFDCRFLEIKQENDEETKDQKLASVKKIEEEDRDLLEIESEINEFDDFDTILTEGLTQRSQISKISIPRRLTMRRGSLHTPVRRESELPSHGFKCQEWYSKVRRYSSGRLQSTRRQFLEKKNCDKKVKKAERRKSMKFSSKEERNSKN